ncbi:monoglyceride lipase, partial [Streptomyces sp. e14]
MDYRPRTGPLGRSPCPAPREKLPRRAPAAQQEEDMADARSHVLAGTRGALHVHEWPHPRPRYAALLVHGYGEHGGRYAGVAGVLGAHGAVVYAPDHTGHGRSAGERVVVADFEDVVSDVHTVADLVRAAHPGLPLVLVGHSMGGLISARYAQRHGEELTALGAVG